MNNIEKLAIKAKKIEWQHERDNWYDSDWGLHIYIDREEKPEKQYVAAWGEGDQENFATFEEAEDWCQNQIDVYVNRVAVVDAKALQSSEPVYQIIVEGAWRDVDKLIYDNIQCNSQPKRILFTHPPASVPPVQSSEPVGELYTYRYGGEYEGDKPFWAWGIRQTGALNDEYRKTYDEEIPKKVIPLFTHPPASVPVEKYNKLLEAFKKYAKHDTSEILCENLKHSDNKCNCGFEQAIAEAEGK